MFVFHAHKQTAYLGHCYQKPGHYTPSSALAAAAATLPMCAMSPPPTRIYIYIYYLRYTRHCCTCKQCVLGDGGNTVSPKININIADAHRMIMIIIIIIFNVDEPSCPHIFQNDLIPYCV